MELKFFTLITVLSALSLSNSEDTKLTLEEVKGQLHSFVKKGFENLETKAPSNSDPLFTRNHHGNLIASKYIKSLQCLEEGVRKTAILISKSMGVAEGESHLDVLKKLTFSNAEREVAAETCNAKHLLEKKNSKGENRIGMNQKEAPKMNNEGSLHHTRTIACPFTPFNETREFDASNNNLETGCGRSEDIFSRLIEEPRYGTDCAIRTFGRGGRRNPRVISNILNEVGGIFVDDDGTQLLMQFGQFMNHDLTAFSFAVSPALCCTTEADNPNCANIMVPDDDPILDPGSCMSFPRSISTLAQAMEERDETQKRDQNEAPACENRINFATAFLDGSVIYGSNDNVHDELRQTGTPFMLTSSDSEGEINQASWGHRRECGEIPAEFLPYLPSDPDGNENVFIAGDGRVNQQAGLTSMHTAWLRYHNLIVSGIRNNLSCRFFLSSDEIFNIAREFVIASLQHITFNEFLPVIFSESSRAAYNLDSTFAYNSSVVVRIDQEFSSAAFRMGHSLVSDNFPIAGREEGPLPLAITFNNASNLRNPDTSPSKILLSQGSSEAMAIDIFLTDALRNRLFGNLGPPIDLFAVNVQRGRDHGLRSAHDYRALFGLGGGLTENLLRDEASAGILDIYPRRPSGVFRNIDLFPAGLAEQTISEDDKLGDLFTNIILNQFSKIRSGDRFWYENNRFSEEELQAIRGTTLADILCETTLIDAIQEKAMEQSDSLTNPIISCFSRRSNREGTVLGLIEAASIKGLY